MIRNRLKMLIILLVLIITIPQISHAQESNAAATARVFTLDECLHLSAENSRELYIADNAVKKARADVTAAFAGMTPSVTAGASYMRMSKETVMQSGPVVIPNKTDIVGMNPDYGPAFGSFFLYQPDPMVINPQTSKSFSLTLAQPLYMGQALRLQWQMARLAYKAERENKRQIEATVHYNTVKAFYDVMIAQESMSILQEQYQSMRDTVSFARQNYQAGLSSRYDVLRAEVAMVNIEPELAQLSNMISTAKKNLLIIIGESTDQDIAVNGEFKYEVEQFDYEALVAKALDERADIQQLELTETINKRMQMLSYAGYQPQVTFAYQWKYNPEPGAFGGEKSTSVLSLQASWTISEFLPWSKTMAGVRKAALSKRSFLNTKSVAEDYIELEIKSIYDQLIVARDSIKKLEQNVQKAEEALRIARRQYRQGLMNSLQLSDAELQLATAKNTHIQKVYNYIIAKAKLERALIGSETTGGGTSKSTGGGGASVSSSSGGASHRGASAH